ncbi:hypothetical protein THICB3180067 [Thiomonas sp. CB3]|nr:hypothetical protein THICB3180067 [Thiomonas sp. CB3]
MKSGAVAMIDALGFRGIWDRWPSAEVMANMHALKRRVEDDLRKIGAQPDMQFEATFLSDTVVLGLSLPGSDPNHVALSAIYVGDIVSRILTYSARSTTPFAYRGAIACGEYEIDSNFILGRAVDDAASCYELAEAAIVWLAPSANDVVGTWLHGQPHNTHFVRHSVPLKGGASFNTYTASPLVQAVDRDDANTICATLLATFKSTSLDIAVKRQNTVSHLRACSRWRKWADPDALGDDD